MPVESGFAEGARLRSLNACFVRPSVCGVATDVAGFRTGSLPRLEPQAIYSAHLHDPWNRIFYLLLTRTVGICLSEDFKNEGPFVPASAMAIQDHGPPAGSSNASRAATGRSTRLYPSSLSPQGAESIPSDSGLAELKPALEQAWEETAPRPPWLRALMQSDVRAAERERTSPNSWVFGAAL